MVDEDICYIPPCLPRPAYIANLILPLLDHQKNFTFWVTFLAQFQASRRPEKSLLKLDSKSPPPGHDELDPRDIKPEEKARSPQIFPKMS